MDIVVNVNIDTKGEQPKVEVKKPLKKKNNVAGGILEFPEEVSEDNSILDLLGIGRT
jgi:hypothetical protein